MAQDQTTVWSSLALSQAVGNCIPWIDPSTFQPTIDTTFLFYPTGVISASDLGTLEVPAICTSAANIANSALTRNYSKLGRAGYGWGSLNMDYHLASTAGNVTINKPAGRVKIAAGQSSVSVSNSMVTINSIVIAVVAQVDATLLNIRSVVCATGSFTITANAAATADCNITFLIINTDS